MWFYIEHSSGKKWTVGFEDKEGLWHPDSDHTTDEEAARRCNWLNGGNGMPYPSADAIALHNFDITQAAKLIRAYGSPTPEGSTDAQ